MAWIYLLIAGLFEVAWAYCLKQSNGFTHSIYSVLFGVTLVISMLLLGLAARNIPLSIAYPVWTGIGAVGAVVVGIFVLQDRFTWMTGVFLTMVVVGILGLKWSYGKV